MRPDMHDRCDSISLLRYVPPETTGDPLSFSLLLLQLGVGDTKAVEGVCVVCRVCLVFCRVFCCRSAGELCQGKPHSNVRHFWDAPLERDSQHITPSSCAAESNFKKLHARRAASKKVEFFFAAGMRNPLCPSLALVGWTQVLISLTP